MAAMIDQSRVLESVLMGSCRNSAEVGYFRSQDNDNEMKIWDFIIDRVHNLHPSYGLRLPHQIHHTQPMLSVRLVFVAPNAMLAAWMLCMPCIYLAINEILYTDTKSNILYLKCNGQCHACHRWDTDGRAKLEIKRVAARMTDQKSPEQNCMQRLCLVSSPCLMNKFSQHVWEFKVLMKFI